MVAQHIQGSLKTRQQISRCVRRAFWYHLTIKPTISLYFLSMSNNTTHVSAVIEPSSAVQGHVHFNIHCSIWYHHLHTTMYVNLITLIYKIKLYKLKQSVLPTANINLTYIVVCKW
jgi:Na+/phosphate symporter